AVVHGRWNAGTPIAWSRTTCACTAKWRTSERWMPERPRLSPEVVLSRDGRALDLPGSGETEPLVLARGSLFCVTNQRGDIAPAGARDLGLFYEDTRHLSYLELLIAGGPPIVLSADISGAAMSQIDLTLTDSQF